VARGTDEAPAAVVETMRSLSARRVRREPMAYILGEREFWGLPFKVSPAVLVPRPDSETLIEAVLSLMPDRARAWHMLDLGLGSGCLLLTLLREYPKAHGVGLEVSAEALAIARENAEALGVAERARLIVGDWRQPGWVETLGGPFDLVVSNPPYIASAVVPTLMPEVSAFEPWLALDGGTGGFDAYRAIIAAGPRLVTAGGFMAVEVGEGQVPEITRLFSAAGLSPQPPWKDLGGVDRVVTAGN
jgi:release factor glutamine methyltransferase